MCKLLCIRGYICHNYLLTMFVVKNYLLLFISLFCEGRGVYHKLFLLETFPVKCWINAEQEWQELVVILLLVLFNLSMYENTKTCFVARCSLFFKCIFKACFIRYLMLDQNCQCRLNEGLKN